MQTTNPDPRDTLPASSGEEEAHLLRRIALQDRHAFETLYRVYYRRLTRFLDRLTRKPQMIDEILDDTMLVVWRKAATFNGNSKVSTWIFAIAYRKAMKALKREGSRAQILFDHDEPLYAPSPEIAFIDGESRSAIKRLVAGLSVEHRAVVELTYYHGCAYKEIAEIVGCPIDTVKTRMFHARRKLRSALRGRNRSETMMRLFRFDDAEHRKATELLPWLVNDTLSGAERLGVERHLAECAACRSEMEDLRTLQVSIAEDDVNAEVTHALGRLNARLHGARPGLSAKQILRWIAAQWTQSRPSLRGAVIAQSAVLAVLIGALLAQSAPHYYRTLGTTPARANAGDQIVVVFNPSLRETELRSILLDLHARIVDGPSPTGAYTLEIAQDEQRAALAKLRRQRSVVFAEPVP